ncbi:MAG: NADH-quinone oxidoreductase subunit L [Myxococcota bacterium]
MNASYEALALGVLFAPLATAALLMLAAPLRRDGLPAATLSVGTALVSLGGALVLFAALFGPEGPELGRWTATWLPHARAGGASLPSAIELGILLDGVSVSMLLVVCFVAAMVQIFSVGYLADEPSADFGRYFTWQSLFLFAMNSLVLAPNLLQVFLGWELVGLASYLLIGFYYRKPAAGRAAVKAFWVTKLADIGLIAGLIVLFRETGGFEWTAVTAAAGFVTALFFVAVMGKSAQFPLHVWLPDAMEGPTPVSALLHAATMVAAGVFLVVRADPLFDQAPGTREAMLAVGAFTALFAAIVAVVQQDIKKVLAYSTCSQLGYMIAALGAGSQVAGFFHLTTHAAFKALLFLSAGSLIHAVHSNDLRDMGGLFSKMRLSATAFTIGALALAGLPGTSGFFSKDLVLEAVAEHGAGLPLLALLAAAFLTAFYVGRVVILALLGAPSPAASHAHEAGSSMTLPLVLLAVPALGLGFLAAPLTRVYATPVPFHLGAVGITASALSLAGLASAWWIFGPARGGAGLRAALAPIDRLARSGAVDRVWVFAFEHGLAAVARAAGWFDRYVVDGLVNLVGYATLALGGRLRRLQTGDVRDYVYAVALGAVVLVVLGLVEGSAP